MRHSILTPGNTHLALRCLSQHFAERSADSRHIYLLNLRPRRPNSNSDGPKCLSVTNKNDPPSFFPQRKKAPPLLGLLCELRTWTYLAYLKITERQETHSPLT